MAYSTARPNTHYRFWLRSRAKLEDPIEEVRPSDIVWFPPGEKHWHVATPTTAMSHIAIGEQIEGMSADWLEKVSDEQYYARSPAQ